MRTPGRRYESYYRILPLGFWQLGHFFRHKRDETRWCSPLGLCKHPLRTACTGIIVEVHVLTPTNTLQNYRLAHVEPAGFLANKHAIMIPMLFHMFRTIFIIACCVMTAEL